MILVRRIDLGFHRFKVITKIFKRHLVQTGAG